MEQRQMSHDDHHQPGHDHDHAERPGVLGWLQHTFAHPHSGHQRVDTAMESNDRGIWAIKVSLVGLGVTALLQLVIVLLSGSVALLADTIHNLGDATTSLPLWVAFALERRGANRRYTYGYGRSEDIAGVLIVLVILFSAVVAGYESVMKLIHPEPVNHLIWVAAAALVGFLGNELVGIFRIRVGKEIGSAALIADGQHSRVDGFTSLAVLIGVVGVAVGVPILDPLIGLAITVAILFIVKDASLAVMRRLLDAIEPDILTDIQQAACEVPGVEDVHQVRARWLGHKVLTDLHITVDSTLSVADAQRIVEQVEHRLRDHIPALESVTIQVCPTPRTRATVRHSSE
jgi:cation diffusion facilitator family transporter